MTTQGIKNITLYCGIVDIRCLELADNVKVVQVKVDSIDDC
jgi:hypothetical protein